MATVALPAGHSSPISSPRLPSPPPFPEVQIGPKSPLLSAGINITAQDAAEAALLEIGATRRIRPGTKAVDMASGPPVVPLADVSFQVFEDSAKQASSTLLFNFKNTLKLSIIKLRGQRPTPRNP